MEGKEKPKTHPIFCIQLQQPVIPELRSNILNFRLNVRVQIGRRVNLLVVGVKSVTKQLQESRKVDGTFV